MYKAALHMDCITYIVQCYDPVKNISIRNNNTVFPTKEKVQKTMDFSNNYHS